MDVTKVLSQSLSKSRDVHVHSRLRVLHLFPRVSTHLLSTVDNLRERKREMLSMHIGLAPRQLFIFGQSVFFFSFFKSHPSSSLFFSLSLYLHKSSGGRWKWGARKHKNVRVCGLAFCCLNCHRLEKTSQKATRCVCKQRSGCYALLKRLETSSRDDGWIGATWATWSFYSLAHRWQPKKTRIAYTYTCGKKEKKCRKNSIFGILLWQSRLASKSLQTGPYTPVGQWLRNFYCIAGTQ